MTTHTRTPMPTPARTGRTAGPARRPRLITLPGVYAPQYDTDLLARNLRREGGFGAGEPFQKRKIGAKMEGV